MKLLTVLVSTIVLSSSAVIKMDHSSMRLTDLYGSYEDVDTIKNNDRREDHLNHEVTIKRVSQKNPVYPQIVLPSNLISEAGFDHFIRSNWTEFTEGETLKRRFFHPDSMEFMSFKIYLTEEINLQGIHCRVFIIEPESFAVSEAYNTTRLTYATLSRKIMQVEGISNIQDTQGKAYELLIKYNPSSPGQSESPLYTL